MTSTVSNPPAGFGRYRNMAEWLHALGDIAPERVIANPFPGTATEEDLLRKVEVDKQLCELIDGILVEKPMGDYESILALLLAQELLNFIRPKRLGAVIGPDGPLRFRIGLVRLPDIAFVSSTRVKAGGGLKKPIASLIPDLAVEVLCPSNRPGEMRRKWQEYFAAGVKFVWMIEPATRTADIYTSVESVVHLDPDGVIDGGDVLPGFSLRLSELFAAADEAAEGSD